MFSPSLVALALAAVASARTFTVKNNCRYTVWPGMFTDRNVSPTLPDHATGWQANPGTQVSFGVPNKWNGRIWGRRDCNFSNPNGATACVTGACNGGLECDKDSGTGVPPATVAEFTLSAGGNMDYYDVSLVDGFNIPVSITTNKGCSVASCNADLNPGCPAPLSIPSGEGCRSACEANIDHNHDDSANCCTGSHRLPETCPPSGVQFYQYFKSACPNSYVYAYDESSHTALWTCDANLNADYTITFCP